MSKFIKCSVCMKGAPYHWCCKTECGKRKACEGCTSPVRGDHCPNDDLYFENEKKENENEK